MSSKMPVPNFMITDFGGNVLYSYKFEGINNFLFMNLIHAVESMFNEIFEEELHTLKMNDIFVTRFQLPSVKVYFCYERQNEQYINQYMLNFISQLHDQDMYSMVYNFPNPISHTLVERFDEIVMHIMGHATVA